MQMKISRPEAYSLMSESDHAVMNERIKELESIVEDCSSFDLNFYLDEESSELFLEIVSAEQKVMYRLVFKIKRNVGRPSLGTTKKVSITLPDEIWDKLEECKGSKSMSAFLRELIMENYE